MKVLQVNVVYKYGSTGKIVSDIHSLLLSRNIEAFVYYGRGKRIIENNIVKLAPEILMKIQSLYSKITGYQYKGAYWGTNKLIKLINKNKPDVVHLQCINGYIVDIYKILDFLKSNNIPTVITLHAEFMFTGGCAHSFDCERWKTGCYDCPERHESGSYFFDRSKEQWNYLNESYRGFNNVVITAVSGWLKERAALSPFFQDKRIEVVHNGLDTDVFHPTDSTELIKRHNLTGSKVILHVTPNFNSIIKGGKYVLELAKRFENSNPEIKIIVIGYNGDKQNLPSNIIPVQFTRDQAELAQYYSLADITLLTSTRETFSMVTAESLCCGTPVVGFQAGGPESITIPEFSSFVPFGDLEKLEEAVLNLISMKKTNFNNEISELAKMRYSKEIMVNQFVEIYNSFFPKSE